MQCNSSQLVLILSQERKYSKTYPKWFNLRRELLHLPKFLPKVGSQVIGHHHIDTFPKIIDLMVTHHLEMNF